MGLDFAESWGWVVWNCGCGRIRRGFFFVVHHSVCVCSASFFLLLFLVCFCFGKELLVRIVRLKVKGRWEEGRWGRGGTGSCGGGGII